jgi:hypothetical protein
MESERSWYRANGGVGWCKPKYWSWVGSESQIAVYITNSCVNCFLVRKESRWATGLIVLGTTTLLTACQDEGAGASKTGTTDPNTAFAEYGARSNTPSGPTGNVSSRRGSGLSGGSGGRGGANQIGF